MIDRYFEYVKETGYFRQKRNEQAKYWMIETIDEQLRHDFYTRPERSAPSLSEELRVLNNEQSSFTAAHEGTQPLLRYPPREQIIPSRPFYPRPIVYVT